MNVDDVLAEALQPLSEPLSTAESLVSNVLARLNHSRPAGRALDGPPAAPRRSQGRWSARVAVAVVAIAAVGLFLLFSRHAPSITLAQVTAAVDRQHWAHLVYRDGSETWVCLDDGKFLMKLVRDSQPPSYYLRDPATRTEQRYDFFREIRLSRPEVWVLGTNRNGKIIPLDVDELTFSDSDLARPRRSTDEDRSKLAAVVDFDIVTEDGRRLGHFSHQRRDALGELQVSKELWVDLATKLPVRIRSWGFAAGSATRVAREGTYEFLEKGPSDLYDLGVPRTIPIVSQIETETETEQAIPAEARRAIAGAKSAVRRFPHRFRVLKIEGANQQTITYVDSGDAHPFGWAVGDEAVGTVGRYFSADCQDTGRASRKYAELTAEAAFNLSVPIPADEISQAFPFASSVYTVLIDGRRWFVLTRTSVNPPKSQLQVLTASSSRDIDDLESQWEFADWNWTELATGKSSEAAPPGQMLVHAERVDLKNDWFVDPARDYTVARHVEYRLNDGKWEKRETRAVKWEHLPDGPWYVSAWETRRRGLVTGIDKDGKRTQQEEEIIDCVRLLITPLRPEDLPAGIFDGDKFLDAAKAAGAQLRVD
jgi:hypothetical protein